MKHLFCAASFALASLATASGAQEVTGLWRSQATDEGYIEIRIKPCGPAICGTIERARNLDGVEGPYPHVGRKMIWDMAADGAGEWSNGKIWHPEKDKVFKSKMELQGDALKVSGCVLGICLGQEWTRVR